jgi:hypothetical protein
MEMMVVEMENIKTNSYNQKERAKSGSLFFYEIKFYFKETQKHFRKNYLIPTFEAIAN